MEESYQRDLLIRLKKGDKSAFNEIYKVFSKPLYLKVLRMVKDKDVADELIQELFIKLWDNHDKIDEQRSFQSYLYVIAQNLVYNHFRKLESDQRLLRSVLAGELLDNRAPNADEQLTQKEVSGLVKNAIDQLSPQRKQAFMLCKIEGKSYREASEIMGVSVATINSHITQSLQTIKAYILKHRDMHMLMIGVYMAFVPALR